SPRSIPLAAERPRRTACGSRPVADWRSCRSGTPSRTAAPAAVPQATERASSWCRPQVQEDDTPVPVTRPSCLRTRLRRVTFLGRGTSPAHQSRMSYTSFVSLSPHQCDGPFEPTAESERRLPAGDPNVRSIELVHKLVSRACSSHVDVLHHRLCVEQSSDTLDNADAVHRRTGDVPAVRSIVSLGSSSRRSCDRPHERVREVEDI